MNIIMGLGVDQQSYSFMPFTIGKIILEKNINENI